MVNFQLITRFQIQWIYIRMIYPNDSGAAPPSSKERGEYKQYKEQFHYPVSDEFEALNIFYFYFYQGVK